MSKQDGFEEKAFELAKEVRDDPMTLYGGCSFNRWVERIVEALRAAHNEAVEGCAKAAEKKLGSVMAGNYRFLVDSYRSQITAEIRSLKSPEGGGG